jgi:putative Holliday junction resolvase
LAEKTKYLGVDFGLKRVGIAVSDESKSYSFQRDYMLNDKNLISKLILLIMAENVELIIIGYPVNFSSDNTDATVSVEKFREELETKLRIEKPDAEIVYYDERFTSGIAAYNLAMSGLSKTKKREKGLIDSISAQIILQDYIDFSKNKRNSY